MIISEFLSDSNFGLASFTLLIYSTIYYNDKIDRFTISDGDRLNWFETILALIFTLSIFAEVITFIMRATRSLRESSIVCGNERPSTTTTASWPCSLFSQYKRRKDGSRTYSKTRFLFTNGLAFCRQ